MAPSNFGSFSNDLLVGNFGGKPVLDHLFRETQI
jgi:hypothetical protein